MVVRSTGLCWCQARTSPQYLLFLLLPQTHGDSTAPLWLISVPPGAQEARKVLTGLEFLMGPGRAAQRPSCGLVLFRV